LEPAALVALAKEKGLQALALTDHDSTAGLQEAMLAGEKLGLRIIPGVEISADYEPGTMHLLGLNFDPSQVALQEKLLALQEARRQRNPMIVERLRAAGVDLSLAEVQAEAKGGQIGRPHFAQVLLNKKAVGSFEEAFQKFLGKGAAAYVPKQRMKSADAIAAIHAAGGKAVLAHPVQLRLEKPALETLLKELKGQGLDGIEVFHSDHNPDLEAYYGALAGSLDLRVSGGSDFHGIPGRRVELGKPRLSQAQLEELLH
jgi:predicted metal-dependent phosphoesterase TrpH